jgi:hypothetical protein
MQEIRENSKTQSSIQSPQIQQTAGAEARLAAVVQAAYILEARTR